MSEELKQLLFKDYESRSEAIWKSEQAGETRVNLLIGLVTLAGGAVGTLLATETRFSGLYEALILAALLASLAVGLVTLLGSIDRNKDTDQCKRQLGLLRQAYRDHFDTDGSWVHYDIFPTGRDRKTRLPRRDLGTLAYVTSGLNAALIAAIAGLIVIFGNRSNSSLALAVAGAVLVAAFAVQAAYVRGRERLARAQLEKLYPEDTHAGGIVYRMENGVPEYLLVRARKKDEWVYPKGRIEPGESHAQAALREVAEEAGVIARVAGIVGRITEDSKKEPLVAKFYLMEKIGELPTDEKRKPRWFPVADAIEKLQYEDSRSLLRIAEQRRLSAVSKLVELTTQAAAPAT